MGEEIPAAVIEYQKRNPQEAALIKAIVRGIAPVLADYIGEAIKLVSERNAALEKRINELEARPVMEYAGVWDQKKVYGSGKFVTDGGSLWHSKRASVGERPGASDAWTLAVKKGRDAR